MTAKLANPLHDSWWSYCLAVVKQTARRPSELYIEVPLTPELEELLFGELEKAGS